MQLTDSHSRHLSRLDRAAAEALIDRWLNLQLDSGTSVSAVDRIPELHRWYVRMRGDEKAVIRGWLTLGELSLRYETQVMPAPEVNVQACYEYLLRRNSDLHGMRFCLGPEDAVYLVGQTPIRLLDVEELDRILGASLAYCDECFPTAMSIGYSGKYQRRRVEPTQ